MTEPCLDDRTKPRLRRLGAVVVWVALVALAVVHGVYIVRGAVDVPYWDEWEMLRPDALSASFDPAWILRPHNEHRIVMTKLQVWALYRLDGWNIAHQIDMNYAVYLSIIALLIVLGRRLAQVPATVTAAFMPFLLSTVCWTNFSMGFQLHFHAYVLFTLAAVGCWFGFGTGAVGRVGGAVCAVIAAYSFSAGVPMATVVVIAYAAWSLWRWRVPRSRTGAQAAWDLLAAAVTIGLIAAWFVGYPAHVTQGRLAWPWTWRFWQFYLNCLSGGFGFKIASVVPGLLILAAWSGGAAVLLRRSLITGRGSPPPRVVGAVVAGLAVLAAIAPIAIGRSTLMDPYSAGKTTRYLEISSMMLPMLMFVIHAVTRGRERRVALAALWLVCAVAFSNDYRFSQYEKVAEAGEAGLHCIASQLDQPQITCGNLYPLPLREKVDRAFELNVSFTRRLPRSAQLPRQSD